MNFRLRAIFANHEHGYTRSYGAMTAALMFLPTGLLFGIVLIYPVLSFLASSLFAPRFTLAPYAALIDDGLVLSVLARTVGISATVAAVTLILGFPVAFLMTRVTGVWAAVIGGAVLLPLWTSVLVRTYAWTVLLQYHGIVNAMLLDLGILSHPLRLMYTTPAVILVMVHVLLPYMVLPLYANLNAIPADLFRAARNLGSDDWNIARHILLPLCLPGLGAGLILVFVVALGFFVIPALVGGPGNMMISVLISRQVSGSLNWPAAAAMSTMLLGVALAVLAIFSRLFRLGGPLGRRPR